MALNHLGSCALQRTRSFKLNEKDIDNMVKGDDMRVYKKHVWGVMRDWKRAKRAPLEFIEDFQTTLQVTHCLPLAFPLAFSSDKQCLSLPFCLPLGFLL